MPLIDPENYEEWEDDVWAISESEAWRKCEFMAHEAEATEVINVTQSKKRPRTDGKYKYTCWFRSEVKPSDNSSNN